VKLWDFVLPIMKLILTLSSIVVFSAWAGGDLNKPAWKTVPTTKPNQTHELKIQTGTCPSAVQYWSPDGSYEGGYKGAMLLETSEIATNIKKVSPSTSKNGNIEFRGKLLQAYTTCQATSATKDFVQIKLKNGTIEIRVKKPSEAQMELGYSGLVFGRPTFNWVVAD